MSNITYPTPALTFYAVYGAGKRVVVGGGAVGIRARKKFNQKQSS